MKRSRTSAQSAASAPRREKAGAAAAPMTAATKRKAAAAAKTTAAAEKRQRIAKNWDAMKEVLFEEAKNGSLQSFQKALLEKELDNRDRERLLNSVTRHKYTVLHYAAEGGKTSTVKWLLAEDGGRAQGFTSVLAKNHAGETALHLAARNGRLDACQAIVNGCPNKGERQKVLNAVTESNDTVLHFAAAGDKSSVVEWLLSNKEGGGQALGFTSVLTRSAHGGETALHLAVRCGRLEVCKAIVNGCRVDNSDRKKILNGVTSRGYTVLHFATGDKTLGIVNWLMSEGKTGGRGAGFDSVLTRSSLGGETALHRAASFGYHDAFRAIIDNCRTDDGERKALLNAVDNDMQTVLHYAAIGRRPAIINWLLSPDGGLAAGFDRRHITALTKRDRRTILHLAAAVEKLECVQAILSNCNKTEKKQLFLAVDVDGWTVLHHAARGEAGEVVKELLQHPECQLIMGVKDKDGLTAIEAPELKKKKKK